MNVKDIAALAEIVRKNELTKLEINGEHIVIEREPAIVQTVSAPAAVQTVAEQMHTAEPIAEVQEKEGTYVRSPAVGVFYAAPFAGQQAVRRRRRHGAARRHALHH